MLESTPALVTNVNEVLGYYSWGSNDPAWKDRAPRLQFVPGALVATFVSSDARTFEEPPPAWTIGAWSDPSTFYAGSPQSLIGDLIRGGATGAAGHVAEPYLDATIRPQVLFPGYLAGFNLAEAYYLAMPYLSWQTVVVGDPLCAPFRKIEIARDELDPAIDRQTELPGFFSPRRLSAAKSTAPAGEDVGALVLAESRVARGDRAGAMEVLESATAANDRALLAQFMLAGLYEEAEQFDQAIDRYQRLLKVSPDQASALNNLAYLLAVRKEQAGDALPLAERAHSLSRGNPLVADTLGWIYHLLGDPARASVFLKQAAAQAPDNAEIRLHAAVVFAELGDQQAAARELAVALRIDPRLASRSDVVALLAKLPPAPPH
jgi:tetratricopeptide (TPR) repeat protein